uniref:Uncharacterized protein n=1 Tax=Toxoplasma gondii TgCATBr9 TaxID=943120 RepID=A0A2T6IFF2_TOXGO|nr:hypothetical protein TGBR9_384640 [Toxoplasma gondii TgCATBr9]
MARPPSAATSCATELRVGKAGGNGNRIGRPSREAISNGVSEPFSVGTSLSEPHSWASCGTDDEDSWSVSSTESDPEIDIEAIFDDAARLGWTQPQLESSDSPSGKLGNACIPTLPLFSAPKSWGGSGLGKAAESAFALAGRAGLSVTAKELVSCSTELDISVDSLFHQRQSLMEAAADLEAALETDSLLVCRIKQLGVAKAIAQLYPEAQWPGEVPLITCLLSRAYARAGYAEQARWHVEAAAALLDSLGVDDAQIACSAVLQKASSNPAGDNGSAERRRTLSAELPEKRRSNTTVTDSSAPSDSIGDTSMPCPSRSCDELSDDLLLMEFFFSLAEALFASRSFTKSIGGFFKAIKHADRALATLGETGDTEKYPSGEPPVAGRSKTELPDSSLFETLRGSETSDEVKAAVSQLKLRRAELLMGVVEASLRVKEVEATRQSLEAVEIFSRLRGSGDVKTLQARYLAAKVGAFICIFSRLIV